MIDNFPARRGKGCRTTVLGSMLVLLAVMQAALAQSVTTADQVPENTEPGRLIVPLSGTAAVQRNGDLVASPSRIDTGLVEIGDYKAITVTLTHTGGAEAEPLVLGEARLIGKNAEEYTSDFAGGRTLSPGESFDIGLLFTPRVPGAKSAGLRLAIDGATAPYVVLFDGWSRYPLTSDLALSVPKLSFGQTLTNQPLDKSFTLENLGDEGAPSIQVHGMDLGGDTPDAFSVAFTPFALAPGESRTVTVTLSSPNAGTKGAKLTVSHDGNNPSLETTLEGQVVQPQAIPVNFGLSDVDMQGATIARGTSIQFGPDGKLYVAEMNGLIKVFSPLRESENAYAATLVETIDQIKSVPNHEDDGTPSTRKGRLLTGLHVAGSADSPVIYAVSSDPRQAAGPSGTDANLDTNSGILHKLIRTGGGWQRLDLVRGLPRSEENHVGNGLLLVGDKILVSMGGHTNTGLPSNNFAMLSEYALSGAVLEIDLGMIGNATYDLPTLDDEDRPGTNDVNDPFGGNDGKNQAKLTANGPVKIFASGLRNAYDLVMTGTGRLYTFDNGPNAGWGGWPASDCLNRRDDGGKTSPDNLHLLERGGYYGHANPTRGSKANTFNASNPQSPIEVAANPVECEYRGPGPDKWLTSIGSSSNGIDEYTASNFGGAMQGDLVVASFGKKIYRIELNGAGDEVTSKSLLSSDAGTTPLDLTAQGDAEPFPGTIWIVDNKEQTLKVLEPADF